MLKIVLIDDEELLRITLAEDLKEKGYVVRDFGNPKNAVDYLISHETDLVISDIKMPYMSGIEVLHAVKKIDINITVIMMTAYGTVDTAIEAMKGGAYDYITKPFDIDSLFMLLTKVKERKELVESNRQYRSFFERKFNPNAFVGSGPEVKQVLDSIKIIGESHTTILISGETGTGKELIANIIHYNSPRKAKPLIKVSCAVLSKEIFESELFGHVKGAFTGATKDRKGRFEMADGGTIYLDDIDDVPLELQVKLLRVLQEREFERVGGNETIHVNVRVLASTKTDLKILVEKGSFREDLFYRLNVFPIEVPPLKNRKEDIISLFRYFVQQNNNNRSMEIKSEVLELLSNYDWPGNVRELKNIAERMVILACDDVIGLNCLPKEVLSEESLKPDEFNPGLFGKLSLSEIMEKMEISMIRKALEQCHGNQSRAAELLKIPSSTLRTKVIKYDISKNI
jgi:DNA-binding NtrC family response regulator